jgi:hypothetical protein
VTRNGWPETQRGMLKRIDEQAAAGKACVLKVEGYRARASLGKLIAKKIIVRLPRLHEYQPSWLVHVKRANALVTLCNEVTNGGV